MTYFVEYLPDSCFFCGHAKSYDNRYEIDGKKFCGIKNMDVNEYFDHNKETGCRPNWCPLKEISDDYLDKMIYSKK